MSTDTYVYRVRDKGGKVLEGSLEAESTALVATKLRQMGYVPIAIDKRQASAMKAELHIPGLGGRVKAVDVSIFSRQFATMINAGLTLIRSLSILGEQTDNKVLAGIVVEVRQDVEKGASLSHSLAKHPKAFNRLYVSMVRAGEAGGVLDSVLLQLAHTMEKQVELKRKIKSAMTYPVAVLGLVLMIVTAMLVFVVPMFKNLYKSLGGKLPLPTQVLLNVSGAFTTFLPLVILGMVGGVWGFKRWIQSERGRWGWDSFKLKLPIFGRLVHKTSITRFARTFSVLLRSGVPILESLEITADTVGNAVVAKAVKDTQEAVKQGESIARPLAAHKVFPAMVVQMMAVGEETGALDSMLEKIGDFYDQEVEALVEALTSLLEPLLIVTMGLVVGGMVIALYMPMFNIIKLIK